MKVNVLLLDLRSQKTPKPKLTSKWILVITIVFVDLIICVQFIFEEIRSFPLLLSFRLPFKKYVAGLPPIFDPPPLVTLCRRLPWPPPVVTTQIMTNFELVMSRPLMQILDLIFAKVCIFLTQTLLSTSKATLKSGDEVVLLQLLKSF